MKHGTLALALTLLAGAAVFLLAGCEGEVRSERRLAFEQRYPGCSWMDYDRYGCAQLAELRRRNDLLEAQQ